MNEALLTEQLAQLPLLHLQFFDTSELEFSQRIRSVCQQECPMYNTNWACPPAVGTVEECEARCLQYPRGLLIASVAEADAADLAACLATRGPHEALTRQAQAIVAAQGLETYVLSTEACAHCARCAYPESPCRHPELMFPCVESHGIVVTALAERYGIEFYAGAQLVTWFSLILFREAPDQ